MSRPLYDYVLLTSISAVLFLLNLGGPPLWDRDEPRNAGCAAEMLERGDWVVPVFNAELRTHKPALLYWLMIGAYSVFGVNAFGARFASAMLGCATVLLTYAIGRRMFDRSVACWAGVILATVIMFGVAARAATPDSLLIFCGTAAIAAFVHGAFPTGAQEHDHELFLPGFVGIVGMYAAMGFGVLAKGPVGLVLPTAVLGMYLLIVRLPRRESASSSYADRLRRILGPFEPLHFFRTCWVMRPLTALVTVCVIALPWYVWVTLRTDGNWTREFLLTHNLHRATSAMEGHSGPPILFYLVAILVGFFPWSVLTIPTGLRIRTMLSEVAGPAHRRAIILLLCWIGVYVGLFSLAKTKLPSYVTPCYPAIALLVALFVKDWAAGIEVPKFWLKVGLANLMAVGLLLTIGLPIAARRFLPGSEWLGCLGLVTIIGGSLCWWQQSSRHRTAAAISLAWTAVAFGICLHVVLPAEVGRHQKYGVLFEKTATHAGPVVAFGHLEPSWVFYAGRPIREFGSKEKEGFLQFLDDHPEAIVITTEAKLSLLGDELADDFRVVHSTAYFLRDRELLLAQPVSLAAKGLADRRKEQIRAR